MGCGESKHAVSTHDSTVRQSKRLNSKKNDEEIVSSEGGDGNSAVVKGGDNDSKVVKVDQILQKEQGDDENVKDGGDKEAVSHPRSPPPAADFANGDGNVKEDIKVDQVVLEKQIDQPKEESIVENVKEPEDREASHPSPPPVAVAEGDSNVKEAEKVDQVVLEKQIDQPKEESKVETVKEAEDRESSHPPPPPPVAVAEGDGNVKEAEKVDQVLLEKQIDQPKDESKVETVKEDEDKKVCPPPPPPDAAAAVVDEVKGGEEKKGLKEENPTEPKMEDAKILAQPNASEEKKDSGEVKEPTKEIEIETHQDAKNDKDLEGQKEPDVETGKAEAVESADAKDSTQNDADEKIPTTKGEIEAESAAEAEKKAD